MKVAYGSDSIRLLRTASLWTFWLSLIAILLLSPFNILSRANFDDTFWFVAPFVASGVAVVAIAFYLFALGLGRAQARHEFVSILTGETARARPIILLLAPFDFSEPGIVARTADQFFSGLAMVAAFFGAAGVAATAQPTLSRPIGYGMIATEQALGAAFWRAIRDAMAEFDDAIIDSQAILVAIGDSYIACEDDKIGLNQSDRPQIFQRFADVAALIVMMPDMSPRVLEEFSQIVSSSILLAKAALVMPRGAEKRWAELAEYAASKLGVTLPPHDDDGCVFRLTSDRRPGAAVSLKAFTRGLQTYLESQTTVGTFSVAELWKSVETSQNEISGLDTIKSSVLPQTASGWARRVAATGYVEDGEALIKQLGGSVVYQESGEILTHEKIMVRVFDEERQFENMHDMVQWIIKDVVPRVTSGSPKH